MFWVYEDGEDLSRAAAGIFVEQARQAVASRGRFAVALSGGHTPQRTYELLASDTFRERVPWERVHIFWGDERCVPKEDPRSNALMAWQALLQHVPIPEEQVHPIQCISDSRGAAETYAEELQKFFGENTPRFDLVFLGLGDDGHTASLFPYSSVLQEEQRWASFVHLPEEDIQRVTLTAKTINNARMIVFLVQGAGKARILNQVLKGPREPMLLPAQLIRPSAGELHWILDQAAAEGIPGNAYRTSDDL